MVTRNHKEYDVTEGHTKFDFFPPLNSLNSHSLALLDSLGSNLVPGTKNYILNPSVLFEHAREPSSLKFYAIENLQLHPTHSSLNPWMQIFLQLISCSRPFQGSSARLYLVDRNWLRTMNGIPPEISRQGIEIYRVKASVIDLEMGRYTNINEASTTYNPSDYEGYVLEQIEKNIRLEIKNLSELRIEQMKQFLIRVAGYADLETRENEDIDGLFHHYHRPRFVASQIIKDSIRRGRIPVEVGYNGISHLNRRAWGEIAPKRKASAVVIERPSLGPGRPFGMPFLISGSINEFYLLEDDEEKLSGKIDNDLAGGLDMSHLVAMLYRIGKDSGRYSGTSTWTLSHEIARLNKLQLDAINRAGGYPLRRNGDYIPHQKDYARREYGSSGL